MKKAAVFLAASAALAAPAFAGGPTVVVDEPVVIAPAPVPVVAPKGNWEGFYAGASLGYGSFDGETAATGATALDADGAIAGVQGGYRWDLGNTVLGIEAAFSGSDIKDDALDGKLKSKTDLKAQLGYDLGTSLIYATAGASWAKADIGGVSHSGDGWVAGLGYDYAVNDAWTVGAEYLYHKYDDFDSTGVDVDGNTLSIRANYRF
ncbi:outer membrane protein [Pseudogemmobacter faecipullorum]|uniref:Porin family protein n=1 Tax=Pseudogemmobacter faecipullorum TaxID=2755041 RepID=A0ABS8CK80_9RHOB|nr:porin family protein [Pseudogemmobacter faecipullorum]MCB5409803.1 porin family protein [Pseudogemmobacter faecipullorum]